MHVKYSTYLFLSYTCSNVLQFLSKTEELHVKPRILATNSLRFGALLPWFSHHLASLQKNKTGVKQAQVKGHGRSLRGHCRQPWHSRCLQSFMVIHSCHSQFTAVAALLSSRKSFRTELPRMERGALEMLGLWACLYTMYRWAGFGAVQFFWASFLGRLAGWTFSAAKLSHR